MKYNFDEIINRKNTDCVKVDAMEMFLNVKDAIPMWVADMDFKTPPFIIAALKKRLEHEVLGYSIKPDAYFSSIINWMQKMHNWKINKEWITFSPGVVAGFTIAIEQFTKPGDKIIVQPPVYFPFFHSITDTGRELVNNPLKLENGRLNFDFEDLKNKITPDVKMLLLCNPHNPGGSVWTKEELIKINTLCLENNILVVSDEIHADIVYKPNSFVPFASISDDAANNSITIRSHSKTFNVAGLTTSYLIIPNKTLLNAYNKKLNTPHLYMGNIFGTEALTAAYENGSEWLIELLSYLHENIKLVTDFFDLNYPKIKVINPESTFLIWIDCRELGLSGKELNNLFLHKIKVAINEGSMFGLGGEGFIRMNIGCPKSIVQQALNRINEIL
ncbi:MAG: pyridoxal phosphate-dependent aminotransferase [Salinivirgaceae bacterium]|nr:pyridoxal phosphate-dependent aminotransferase [Salinivirgaceae bacterium]